MQVQVKKNEEKGKQDRYFNGEVKTYCPTCDESTWHLPVKRYFTQTRKGYVPCKRKTSKSFMMLRCNECGHEVKKFKKLAY